MPVTSAPGAGAAAGDEAALRCSAIRALVSVLGANTNVVSIIAEAADTFLERATGDGTVGFATDAACTTVLLELTVD